MLVDPIHLEPMSRSDQELLVVALGAIGGLAIGFVGFKHVFQEGWTPKERNQALFFVGSLTALFGIMELAKLDDFREYREQANELVGDYTQYLDPLQHTASE